MLRRVDALRQDHARLRLLLEACESAAPERLKDALGHLQQSIGPHFQAKQGLYSMALEATRSTGDLTGLSLLGIFRTNLDVTSSALQGFLRTQDAQPERMRQRLGTVTGAVRSLLDTEEKVVFPLCARLADALEKARYHTPPGGNR